MKSIAAENFIANSIKKHGTSFDYSQVEYVNAKTHVNIKCIKHNHVFTQTPDKHLQTVYPCPLCLTEHKKLKKQKKIKRQYKPIDEHLSKLENKFNTKFNVVGEYLGVESIVEFTCKKHGVQQEKYSHLRLVNRKYCCIYCANEFRTINKTKSPDTIPKTDFKIDLSNYVNRKSVVKCTCPKHGVFYKKVQKIISGQGMF